MSRTEFAESTQPLEAAGMSQAKAEALTLLLSTQRREFFTREDAMRLQRRVRARLRALMFAAVAVGIGLQVLLAWRWG